MPQCDFLLDAGIVITQNAGREILHNAAIAINAGKIAAIGPCLAMHGKWRPERTLDYADCLVMPGLINAHAHAAMTFARGFADDLPLMEWLRGSIFPIEARLTEEIVHLGSLLGYAEMLASGTTACVDMYIFEQTALAAAERAGLRCMGGEAIFGFPSAAMGNHHAALAATRELAEKYKRHQRISIAVNPHSVYTASPEILAECRDVALEMDIPIHIHLAETAAETAECLKNYGRRPVAHLDNLGLLEARLIGAHLVDITAAEAELLARKGASGAHNPSSNMKLASGAAPVGIMLDVGLPLGLGTDGPASNNQLNLFVEMRLAALLQKLAGRNPAALPAAAVLDMATLGGAKVLGNASLGRLEPGAAADCIALDLTRPNMQPLHNPVSQVAYAASGHECRMTMVAGEVLYQDGKFTRFDYEALLREAGKLKRFAQGA